MHRNHAHTARFSPNLNQFPVCCTLVTVAARRGAFWNSRAAVRMFIFSFFSKLSVRARVIVLGLIPLIGFLANAVALKSGDTQVGRSFESVQAETRGGSAHLQQPGLEIVARAGDPGLGLHAFERAADLSISGLERNGVGQKADEWNEAEHNDPSAHGQLGEE